MDTEHMEGQILATQAAIRALISTHPDRNKAALAVQRELEKLTAIGMGKTLSESFLEGISYARKCILPARRKPHPK